MSVYDQPVSIGDVLEVTVEKEGSEGDGIAFVEGLAVFVPEAKPGDEVSIRIEHLEENYAVAEVWDR